MKKTTILLSVMLLLTPILAFARTPADVNAAGDTTVFNSDFLVQEGTTIFYDIDQLGLPPEASSTDFTLPNFAGNQLYVKIMHVEEGVDFGGITGKRIWFAIGLMFGEDETFTIGSGVTATDIIVPAGAATPSAVIQGLPHFNGTEGIALFALNNNWTAHESILTDWGLTVTNGATEFEASQGTTGAEFSGTWRKSDGIMTHLLIDNVIFGDANFTGVTMEFTFDRLELNALPATVGDIIEFDVDIADLEITGEGDLYNQLNQTEITSVQDELSSYVGTTMIKLEVTEVKGVYYLCDVYNYDETSGSLVLTGETVFNGFFGSMSSYDPFNGIYISKMSSYDYNEGLAPWITPDWAIYEGQMTLMDTLLGVYFEDIMDLMSPPTDEFQIGAMDASMELIHKGDFYFFRAGAGTSFDINLGYTASTVYDVDGIYPEGLTIVLEAEGYLAYTESGIGAAIRAQMKFDATVEFATPVSGIPTGTISVRLDFKLRNPLYDPPDVLRGGFIPGYTWFIAIPALMSVAVVTVVIRKRK